MTTSTINLIKLEPAPDKHLRNKNTGEVYEGFIYIAESLSAYDFEEISQQEYDEIKRQEEEEEENIE